MNEQSKERLIDYGTFVLAALIAAVIQLEPELLASYGATAENRILITIGILLLSQVGSKIAKEMARKEVPAEVQAELYELQAFKDEAEPATVTLEKQE